MIGDPRDAGQPRRDPERLIERMAEAIARIEERLSAVQFNLIGLDKSVSADITELRNDIGDLRVALSDHREQQARHEGTVDAQLGQGEDQRGRIEARIADMERRLPASVGVAVGAAVGPVTQQAAVEAARQVSPRWWQWVVGLAAALLTLATFADNLPKVARFLDRSWSGLVKYEDKPAAGDPPKPKPAEKKP